MNVLMTIERENAAGEVIATEVNVAFTHHRAHRGQRDTLCGVRGAGPALEPDEPDELVFESATDEDGNDVELTEQELQQAEEAGYDNL